MAVQGHYPIERFDPLLRDLVGWGLVERRETKTRTTWQLVPDAQRRLDELASPAPGPATGADFYFGRLCANCHQRALTRLHGDSYMCDKCWAERQAGLHVVVPEPSPPAEETHFWRRSRPGQTTTLTN